MVANSLILIKIKQNPDNFYRLSGLSDKMDMTNNPDSALTWDQFLLPVTEAALTIYAHQP